MVGTGVSEIWVIGHECCTENNTVKQTQDRSSQPVTGAYHANSSHTTKWTLNYSQQTSDIHGQHETQSYRETQVFDSVISCYLFCKEDQLKITSFQNE